MPIDFETCFGFQHCVSTQSKLKISSIRLVKTLTLTVFQGKSYAKQHENHFKQSAFKEIEKKLNGTKGLHVEKSYFSRRTTSLKML